MSEKKVPVNKVEFEADTPKGKQKVAVTRPSRKEDEEAEFEYIRVFTDLFRKDALLSDEVDAAARKRGFWSDEADDEQKAIIKFLEDSTEVVEGRVEGTTKEQGRTTAIEMIRKRNRLENLVSRRYGLEQMTAEARARQAKFNFVLVRCTRYADTGKQVFSSVDDYLQAPNDNNVVSQAGKAMMLFMFDHDADHIKKRPEYRFLLKQGYCNEDLRLIDPATKRLVDADGKFIDDEGYLVDDDGHRINGRGLKIDENGVVIGKTYPFLD